MFKKIFIISTVFAALFYTLASLTSYITALDFWPMTFLALGFPLVFAGYIFLIICWFFIHKRTALVLFVLLWVGHKNIFSTFAFHFPQKQFSKKDSTSLRILSWNVNYFFNSSIHADSANAPRRLILNYIKKINPDIIVFQDYVNYETEGVYSNIDVFKDSLGYKYFYFGVDYFTKAEGSKISYGNPIFSKYPITDTGLVQYPKFFYNENLAFADIHYQNKNFRVFNTHLLSMNLNSKEEQFEDPVFKNFDEKFIFTATKFQKLKRFDKHHVSEALVAQKAIQQSPYPIIFCGDFNSIPASSTYQIIRGNLNDSFVEQGFGFGGTYANLTSRLRIDYILTDKKFKVVHYFRDKVPYSDHFPVVCDIQWK